MSDYEYISKYDSPNFTPATKVSSVFGRSRTVKSITIHHWGVLGQKFENVLNWFMNPQAKTSAHYICESGKVACIVDPDDAAWHAGSAEGNATSIGIELRPEATEGDYATAAKLIKNIRSIYGDIPLVPHNKWRSTACPGKWDLNKLDRLSRGGSSTKTGSVYVVKPGDGWYAIARNTSVDLEELLTINGKKKTDILHPGDELKLPGNTSPSVSYKASSATHNGKLIKYYYWKLPNPKGVFVYLHGDNKPDATTNPDRSDIQAMARVAASLGYSFVLPISPFSSWYINYEQQNSSDRYRNQRMPGSQVEALRTFIPAVVHDLGSSMENAVIMGHSGGAEAISLHLARTKVEWLGGRGKFGLVGGGTANGVHDPDAPESFRKNTTMKFYGSSTGDNTGATTAGGGSWSAWNAASGGVSEYKKFGYKASLIDTGAEGHNSYNFAKLVEDLIRS